MRFVSSGTALCQRALELRLIAREVGLASRQIAEERIKRLGSFRIGGYSPSTLEFKFRRADAKVSVGPRYI
jgi:hypothetical protein